MSRTCQGSPGTLCSLQSHRNFHLPETLGGPSLSAVFSPRGCPNLLLTLLQRRPAEHPDFLVHPTPQDSGPEPLSLLPSRSGGGAPGKELPWCQEEQCVTAVRLWLPLVMTEAGETALVSWDWTEPRGKAPRHFWTKALEPGKARLFGSLADPHWY